MSAGSGHKCIMSFLWVQEKLDAAFVVSKTQNMAANGKQGGSYKRSSCVPFGRLSRKKQL